MLYTTKLAQSDHQHQLIPGHIQTGVRNTRSFVTTRTSSTRSHHHSPYLFTWHRLQTSGQSKMEHTLAPPGSCRRYRPSLKPCGIPLWWWTAAHLQSGEEGLGGGWVGLHTSIQLYSAFIAYVVGVEFGQSRLPLIVEHNDGLDHLHRCSVLLAVLKSSSITWLTVNDRTS